MPSRNYVELIGHLGRKPELRRTKTGAPVASFSIATNESWYDEKQQLRERTEWHRVVVWGKPAETVAQHLDVGRLVLVEGQLRTREYADKQGARRVVTEVHARPGERAVIFLDGKRDQIEPPLPEIEDVPPSDFSTMSGGDDDIPF
jgi:single-strand DNA-binding protein